jgi:hypothetical protein
MDLHADHHLPRPRRALDQIVMACLDRHGFSPAAYYLASVPFASVRRDETAQNIS